MIEWDFLAGDRGLRLRICEWRPTAVEDRTSRATVILHGFLEQGAAWDEVARLLPGRVLAPDQRGHGLSEHVGAGGFYHFWDYVSDLDALVRHVGGPVDLVGHSMGGGVACLYAGLRPEQVRTLALIEGIGPPDAVARTLDRGREFLDHRENLPRHRALVDVEDGVRRMRRMNPRIPEATARRLVARTTRPVDTQDRSVEPGPGTLVWTWDPLHRARSPQPFSAALFSRYLEAITAPTLLVTGGDSGFVLPDQGEREALVPHARKATIPDAGHLVHHDAPETLARLLHEHLEHPSPARPFGS